MFQDISYCRSETLNIRKEIAEIYSHMNENSIEKYSHTNKQSMQIKAAATLSWVILLISSPLNLTAVNGSLCQLILNTLMLSLWQITGRLLHSAAMSQNKLNFQFPCQFSMQFCSLWSYQKMRSFLNCPLVIPI